MSPKGARMRSRRYLLAACTLLAVGTLSTPSQASSSANWPQFRLTPDHTGYNASEAILTPHTVGGVGVKWSYTTKGAIMGSASVVAGIAYVGSADNSIYAFNIVTGTVLWKVVTGGDIGSTPD